ncbi:site-specific integrase [Actinomadura welshii]|uniref:site-specific integrase n=1 Tax=Actinomadura welshii TaxID=3103817 RepID=UPI0003FCB40F
MSRCRSCSNVSSAPSAASSRPPPSWSCSADAAPELAEDHPDFQTAGFTPHDFRRLLATELVNNGLPIHIGAALLGHLNLQTTRGYVAVFNEDLVRHYQAYLDRRRQARPADETVG